MALTCDNCGSIIGEGEYITVPFDLTEDKVGSHTADDWYYYCDGECTKVVRGLLENLRHSGHAHGPSDLQWRLVDREAEDPTEEPEPEPEPLAATAAPDDYAIRFGDLPPKLGVKRPKPDEIRARLAGGTPLSHVLSYKATRSKLLSADLVTLEDIAELTEVEFRGVPGVGSKTLNQIADAFKEKGLAFADGPTQTQLAQALRLRREEAGSAVKDVAKAIADAHEIPKMCWADNEDKEVETHAYRELEYGILFAELGRKPPMPVLVKLLAEHYGTTREELLAGASNDIEALV